jgi:hypothetical protein
MMLLSEKDFPVLSSVSGLHGDSGMRQMNTNAVPGLLERLQYLDPACCTDKELYRLPAIQVDR